MLEVFCYILLGYVLCGAAATSWLFIADPSSRDDLRSDGWPFGTLTVVLLVLQWPLFVWFITTWDDGE